jgi:hypothetical protein
MSPTFAAQKYTPESDTINIQSFFDGRHKKAACTPYPLFKNQNFVQNIQKQIKQIKQIRMKKR